MVRFVVTAALRIPQRGNFCALGSVCEQKGESPFMAELPAIN